MSAFHVSKKTIDHCVGLLNPSAMTGDDSGTELSKALWELNALALVARYDVELGDFSDDIQGYVYEEQKGSDVQQLKSLSCLTYQCCEGDIPETVLFKKIFKVEHDTIKLLSPTADSHGKIPGWDEADWDA